MADLNFSQPARRNLAVPIVIALVILGVGAALILTFTPHTTADITIQKQAVYNSHLVFKSDSLVVGHDTVQDDVYVIVTLQMKDQLHLPIFLKDFTGSLTPANPDGTPAETLNSSAIEKLDIPNLYTSFPKLKSLAEQQNSSLLLRETQIDPGKSAAGMILLRFPVTQATWEHRKSATITIDLYHQQPITVEIPKS